MEIAKISFRYLKWHYTYALFSTFRFWKNMLSFLFHYFSISFFFRNLFSPWKQTNENTTLHSKYFNLFIYGPFMRIVGFFIRLLTILAGFITLFFCIISLPFVFFIWIILPIVDLKLFLYGLTLIFFS